MAVEQRGPAVGNDSNKREARVNDKSTHQFARPEEEPIHQGEG
jgi:hypothetical protein